MAKVSYLGKLIGISLWAVSVFVLTNGTDPVNAPKFFLIGVFSCAALGAIHFPHFRRIFINFRFPIVLIVLFNVFSIFSVLASKAPVSQSLYGVYGRNNGYFLYLFLSLIFIASLFLSKKEDFRAIIYALLAAGVVNVVYALWVLSFGDFIPWNNPYGNLLGTFGNPNFAGSFFGILSAVPMSFLVKRNTSSIHKLGSFVFLVLIFIGIIETHAVQGKVLFVFSVIFIGFFAIRERSANNFVQFGYLGVSSLLGFFSVLGALQIGPLTQIIYKESVSLRGQYWYAGWKTGISHPIFGVGFDSYGDWYRFSRKATALIRPGIDTVSNTAHNVFMDVFSFGGFPLLIIYLAINLYILTIVINYFRNSRISDPIFVALSTAWLSYQLQSLISINQIGLAVWGWALGASLIAYSKALSEPTSNSQFNLKKGRKSTFGSVITPSLRSTLAGAIGLVIAIPPLSSDINWKKALDSRDVIKIENALVSSYFNPLSTQRYNSAVALFETNNLKDLAYKYALLGVKYNPNSYEAWKNLYQIEKSDDMDRQRALRKMRQLDPKNPNLKAN